MTEIRIIIADDHSMLRKALEFTIIHEVGINNAVFEPVESCEQLMGELKNAKYTHLILDINLKDCSSLEVIQNIKSLYPNLNIIMFSAQPFEIYKTILKNYGIKYYISKSDLEVDYKTELSNFFSQRPSIRNWQSIDSNNPFSALSPREMETLHYWLRGITTKETANNLGLADSTISAFKSRILEKTDTSNIVELKELACVYKIDLPAKYSF